MSGNNFNRRHEEYDGKRDTSFKRKRAENTPNDESRNEKPESYRENDRKTSKPTPKPDEESEVVPAPPAIVEKPNFGLSGALADDTRTGIVYRGVKLKWTEPGDAATPPSSTKWSCYVFKGPTEIPPPISLNRQSAWLFGRERRVADIPTDHPSCSSQHAVLQFRRVSVIPQTTGLAPSTAAAVATALTPVVKPYIMDLESVNGTFLNGERIESARYIELRPKDVLRFGQSTREYVILNDKVSNG